MKCRGVLIQGAIVRQIGLGCRSFTHLLFLHFLRLPRCRTSDGKHNNDNDSNTSNTSNKPCYGKGGTDGVTVS